MCRVPHVRVVLSGPGKILGSIFAATPRVGPGDPVMQNFFFLLLPRFASVVWGIVRILPKDPCLQRARAPQVTPLQGFSPRAVILGDTEIMDSSQARADQPQNQSRQAWKRWGILGAGWILLILGIAALVLPGPGLLGVAAGLALLASQYSWAKRLLRPVKARALKLAIKGVQTWPRIALSVLSGLALIAVGIVWACAHRFHSGGRSVRGGGLWADGQPG